jgi:hypothetical protein
MPGETEARPLHGRRRRPRAADRAWGGPPTRDDADRPESALRRHARTHPPNRRRAETPNGSSSASRSAPSSTKDSRPTSPTKRSERCETRGSSNPTVAANGGPSTRCYAATCSSFQARGAVRENVDSARWAPLSLRDRRTAAATAISANALCPQLRNSARARRRLPLAPGNATISRASN